MSSLKRILTRKRLRHFAGELSYARGVQYFEQDAVEDLIEEGEGIIAKVHGTQTYSVKLWIEEGDLQYACTCPLYESEMSFCKHCVAVGLAHLREQSSQSSRSDHREGVLSLTDVKSRLFSMEKERLTSIILDHASEDEEFRDRLLMIVSRSKEKLNLSAFRKAIDHAAHIDYRGGYVSPYEYHRRIRGIIKSLHELLSDGKCAEVIELSEYLLDRLEENVDLVEDDCGASKEVRQLHLDACRRAHPDPVTLAKKLFRRELTGSTDAFYDASQTYQDVLGKNGIKAYRSLVEAEWEGVPPLLPGSRAEDQYHHRYRITDMMERFAPGNDLEKLISIKSKDLSSPSDFLEIAELYQKNNKFDKALDWAERGLREFPENNKSILRVYLAGLYQTAGRHDEAMQLIWAEFNGYPHLENYKLLKNHAIKCHRAGEWLSWREKAISFIRESIERRKTKSGRVLFLRGLNDHSDLVQIYLWEKNIEQAWLEAQKGDCSGELWLKLAAAREESHPEDSLAVYQSFVEPVAERKNNDAYEEAIGLVKKVLELMRRLGREKQSSDYLQTLKTQHKRKKNFLALLNKVK